MLSLSGFGRPPLWERRRAGAKTFLSAKVNRQSGELPPDPVNPVKGVSRQVGDTVR
jgi:hypothetical protein